MSSIRAVRARLAVAHLALAGVLGLSAVLQLHRLSQNGYANNYYSAAVKSMLASWHNFVFVAFDRGGLETVDKPPIGLWIQAASARVFGFSSLSLLIPEAVGAVLACGALYLVVSRRFGRWAGVASALALAVFPSFVAISRDNDPDVFLILFMILGCGAALRSIETGRLRWLLASAVLLGLAFNTKTLAAYLALPGIALAYLIWAPHRALPRVGRLIAAGLVLLAVSVAWLSFVDLTPAHDRPFVGSSTDNSEFGLTLNYNGVGRVGGQVGGPGRIPHVSSSPAARAGGTPARVRRERRRALGGAALRPRTGRAVVRRPAVPAPPRPQVPPPQSSGNAPPKLPVHGRLHHPVAFSGPTGVTRLFNGALGDQGAWLLPLAAIGLIAAALAIPRFRDRRWPALVVLGGWFVVEAGVLSLSKGIVHPYYVSALGPGLAAMVGVGVVAMADLVRRSRWLAVVPAVALATTVVVQVILMDREHYLQSYEDYLIAAAAVAALAIALAPGRLVGVGLAAGLGVLVAMPTGYTTSVWDAPVEGTFPAAGPHQAAGPGGVGVPATSLRTNLSLIRFLRSHRATARWPVLTDASSTAAPLILLGLNAGAMGGYSGTDPALNGPSLARLIRQGEARYVLLGGAYSTRGGNRATAAVASDCRVVPQRDWRPPGPRIVAGPPTPGTAPPSPVPATPPVPPAPVRRGAHHRRATTRAQRRLAARQDRSARRALTTVGALAAGRARATVGTVGASRSHHPPALRSPSGPQGPGGVRGPAPAGLGVGALGAAPRAPSTPVYVLTLYDCAGRTNLLAGGPAGSAPAA